MYKLVLSLFCDLGIYLNVLTLMCLVALFLPPAAPWTFLDDCMYIVYRLNGWLAFAPGKRKRLLGSSFKEGNVYFDITPWRKKDDTGSGKVSYFFINLISCVYALGERRGCCILIFFTFSFLICSGANVFICTLIKSSMLQGGGNL